MEMVCGSIQAECIQFLDLNGRLNTGIETCSFQIHFKNKGSFEKTHKPTEKVRPSKEIRTKDTEGFKSDGWGESWPQRPEQREARAGSGWKLNDWRSNILSVYSDWLVQSLWSELLWGWGCMQRREAGHLSIFHMDPPPNSYSQSLLADLQSHQRTPSISSQSGAPCDPKDKQISAAPSSQGQVGAWPHNSRDLHCKELFMA